jgi:hypothetical protein
MTEGTRVDFLEKNNASFHTHLEGHHVRLQEQVGTSHDSHLDPVLRTSWSVGARQLSYSLCEQVVLTKCFHQPLSHTRRFPCRLIVVTGDGIKITFQRVKLVIYLRLRMRSWNCGTYSSISCSRLINAWADGIRKTGYNHFESH